jgi:AraC-like DNA-binding protein
VQLKRAPIAALRPFVRMIWLTDQRGSTPARTGRREHVLPTGDMHLVFRLGGDALRVFDDADDREGVCYRAAVVGGPRSRFYVKDVSQPSYSLGVQLHPGAAQLLFGVGADELAERHASLDELWGGAAERAHEQLAEANDPAKQMALLEALLCARLPAVRHLHPAVARALERFSVTSNVGEVVRESGYSHRGFVAVFRRNVGLAPKLFTRVRRFQGALRGFEARPAATWADIAAAAGYSDQAHLTREFVELAGVRPEQYRGARPEHSHHLRLAGG